VKKPPASGLVVGSAIASAIAAFGIVFTSRRDDESAIWLSGGVTLVSIIFAVVLWLRSRNEQR